MVDQFTPTLNFLKDLYFFHGKYVSHVCPSVPRHCVHQLFKSNWRPDRNLVYTSSIMINLIIYICNYCVTVMVLNKFTGGRVLVHGRELVHHLHYRVWYDCYMLTYHKTSHLLWTAALVNAIPPVNPLSLFKILTLINFYKQT